MQRDGALTSIWQHQMPPYVTKGKLNNDVFDVLIVGGGITGLATALELQKAGKKCLLAEAHTLGFGTSGGTTAHLNTFMDTSYAQIEKDFGEEDAQSVAKAAREALDLVAKNIREYNIDCDYSEQRGYLYAQDEKQTKELDDIYDASKRAGCEIQYDDKIPVPMDFIKTVAFDRQARFHPAKYMYGLANAFEEAGGIILQDCRVTGVHEKGDHLYAESSLGNINCSNLVYATHVPPGVNLLHFRCAPYRSYVVGATLKDKAYPDDLAYDMYDPYHYYRTQEIDGQKYLVAGGEDHKTGHLQNTEESFRKLEAYLRKSYDIEEVSFKWSSQFYSPADGLPYIGHLPGTPNNFFVATGFGGNGMTYSHVAAILLSDLLIKGESRYGKLFDPNRIKPVAGFENFIKEAADVVARFIGDRFSKTNIKELAELAPGEAKVVKYDGESIALYKDENGALHAVNPSCTHINCMVDWNSAERSWDCPCHGSRFSMDGEMLTAPARKDLEKINLAAHEE